jgi:hypothetical protein
MQSVLIVTRHGGFSQFDRLAACFAKVDVEQFNAE